MDTLVLLTLLVIVAAIVMILLVAMDLWFAGKARRGPDKPCMLDSAEIIRVIKEGGDTKWRNTSTESSRQ